MAYATINKPEDYFKAVLYTGTHSSVPTVTVGFKSDFLWLKSRTQTYDHNLLDTTRGGNSKLSSNNNNAVNTTGDSVTFNATTFQPSGQAINESGQGADNMISWNWKANGGTTSTNTDGSQNSTVQVNSAAGFSIVRRTGTGSAGATYGHGLGAVPDVIINKGFNTNEWYSYFKAIGGGSHWIDLSGSGAATADANMWNNTDATSSVFTVGNSGGSNGNGVEYINYCFTSIQGYSKFGTYSGNGNSDGPFTYTGFKPAWLMIKRTDASSDGWYIFDSTRSPFNLANVALRANSSNVEGGESIDLLSNGFKQRIGGNNNFNNASGTYLYMAFAQNPFVATNDVIALAR